MNGPAPLAAWLAAAREDAATALAVDPAARTWLEVVLTYPGVHAVWAHRAAHALWQRPVWRLSARVLAGWSRRRTGIEIHPGAQLGRRVFIDHGMGVVIGETAVVGDDVRLYHGATLGGHEHRSVGLTAPGGRGGAPAQVPVRRHPMIGDGVMIGAGASVIGPVVVGAGARIGAGAVVIRDVPAGAVAVGVPARLIGARA